jgi:hypothetical protein
VSVKEKAGLNLSGMDRETSANEPLLKCRNNIDDVETGDSPLPRDKCGSNLFTVHTASGIKAA